MTTTKRLYEALIVLNTKGREEGTDALFDKVRTQIENEGASVQSVEHLGRREFAYNARHLEGGHYVKCAFEAEPEAIGAIKAALKLNHDVFLQHYQRKG